MSYPNPTPIRLGMTGTFMGRCYRVMGRVVVGMEEDGQTYTWNEFNLVADDGASATLVHELTEAGPEWRMFTLFEPTSPLSVEEAAAKQVGDTVDLDGRELRVTLVDQSVVFHIEGEAPEGVEMGDAACYFNAEGPDRMMVVSWTGEEVECYRGVDLPADAVAAAFGLKSLGTGFAAGRSWSVGNSGSALPGAWRVPRSLIAAGAMGLILLAVLVTRQFGCRDASATQPPFAAAPLSLGATGTLGGITWHVRGQAVAGVAEVGRRFDRHEFHLVGAEGERALLVFGTQPGRKEWVLFTPVEPAASLTPLQAAAKRVGDKLDFDGEPATVTGMLRVTLRQTRQLDLLDLLDGRVLYGLSAQSRAGPVLVRWDADKLLCYRGRTLSADEVISAFSQVGPGSVRK